MARLMSITRRPPTGHVALRHQKDLSLLERSESADNDITPGNGNRG
jgi:hypothetical protein